MKVLEKEVGSVSDVQEDAAWEIQDLNDVQLAIIGGGCGEVVFH